jgi:hypothetical protein
MPSARRIAPRPAPTAWRASRPGLRRPAAGGRARRAGRRWRSPRGRWWRSSRLEGLDQAHRAREPARQGRQADRRRRHRQHLPRGHRRPVGKSLHEAGHARHRAARAAGGAAARIPLPSDVVVATEFAKRRRPTCGIRRAGRRADPRHRPRHLRQRCLRRHRREAGTIVWNGPVGVFEFDSSARAPPARRRPSRAAGVLASPAAATRWPPSRSTASRTCFLYLHRRRRLPRVPRGQDAAGGGHPRRACPRLSRPAWGSCMRRTKIIATLGPATDKPGVLAELVAPAPTSCASTSRTAAGRTNVRQIAPGPRAVRRRRGPYVAILGDLQGPKIRIERFRERPGDSWEGQDFVLDIPLDPQAGTAPASAWPTSVCRKDVTRGDVLLLDDGQIVHERRRSTGRACAAPSRPAASSPTTRASIARAAGFRRRRSPRRTRTTSAQAASAGVDWLAVSFVRDADDMHEARDLLRRAGGTAT